MNKNNDLQVLRHSAAHLLAHAVSEIFPDTQLTIGPATETGFFMIFYQHKILKKKIYLFLKKECMKLQRVNYL